MPSPDDRESWNSLRAGNREAFERFYRKHAPRLLSFLRRCLGDSKAAEDISQEAFLQLWQRPNGFNPAQGTLKAYLFGIAAKRAADWWRHRAATSPPPERALRPGEAPVLIANALERIGPDARSLLWLRDVEGYSYQELAEMLAIPLGTVKSRLFVAREQLRRVWKGEEPVEDL